MNRRSFVELMAASVGALPLSVAAQETQMSRTEPIIVGPGQTRCADGRSLVVPDELQCKVRTADLGGRLCIMLADHAPWEGPPLHTHRDGDEWFYVVKGEFVYEVGGKLHRVVEGGSLVAPQKIPHRLSMGLCPAHCSLGLLRAGGWRSSLKRVPDDAETHLPRLLPARSWWRCMRSTTWTT